MLKKFKLKHLSLLMEEQIDYAGLMVELDDYKNPVWKRRKAFTKSFKRVYQFIEEVKGIDPKKVMMNIECPIRAPFNIDGISFAAMMEIHSTMSNPGKRSTLDLMGDIVAIACYQSCYKNDFDSDCGWFKRFRKIINDSPALDIMGLYNHIDAQIVESQKLWEQLFFEVNVEDNDYIEAGGARMSQFNVINTIKNTCTDFNVSYKGAWQMPYGVIQTNSLSKASASYVQHRMTEIKEARMKWQRKQRG